MPTGKGELVHDVLVAGKTDPSDVFSSAHLWGNRKTNMELAEIVMREEKELPSNYFDDRNHQSLAEYDTLHVGPLDYAKLQWEDVLAKQIPGQVHYLETGDRNKVIRDFFRQVRVVGG